MGLSDEDRVTHPVRIYRGDLALLMRTVRREKIARSRNVTAAEIIHEQLAQLRLAERAAERERGNGT